LSSQVRRDVRTLALRNLFVLQDFTDAGKRADV